MAKESEKKGSKDGSAAKKGVVAEVVKAKKPTRAVDMERRRGFLVSPKFTKAQATVIRREVAKDLTDDELALFFYRCRAYGLDPLKGEVSVQVYNKNNPEKRQMVVVVQRDGYLTIAHKSGQFDGMQSGSRKGDDGDLIGWAKVWNKSADHAIEVEVYEEEYNPYVSSVMREPAYQNLWKSKPRTMIQKVAESQALRRAFNISGLYEPGELASWNGGSKGETRVLPQIAGGDKPATEAQLKTIEAMGGDADEKMTKQEAAELIMSLNSKKK